MPTFYQNADISAFDRVYTYRQDDSADAVDVTDCLDVEVDQQGSTYVFYFITPRSEWCIEHSLGKYPDVFLQDEDGNQLLADIQHINSSYIIAYFNGNYSGTAFIN